MLTSEVGTLTVPSEEEEAVGDGVPLGPSKPGLPLSPVGLESEGGGSL